MEYEANLFAAEIILPDHEIIDYMKQGYAASQIAVAMNSDVNLIALKATDLKRRGLALNIPDFKINSL